ncbi:MAG: M24 family metallopeptidase [Fretibacterium sp.]|uniref:M24 family metallopeptidase n=1 Tax=Fretibacterium sp. OH1220_COT-178 TaxID=2491047 RepID=UPI000F5FD27C|nr:M24 family metallopeptidase [Fretibacterium sp. OH1220_COT-178]MDO4785586.1 M24 family metallopeptidase [Fretibacterium sp.]RRD65157.1 M24 family metallopeptidase [Fretibacterium sp. OH1220_COT-178]
MNVPQEEIHGRWRRVREEMADAGVDVLVTGASAQMEFRGALRYLANYVLPVFEEYLVLPLTGAVALFTHDAAGADYAARYGATDEVRIVPGHEYNSDPGRCVAEYVRSFGPGRVGLAGQAGLSANFYLSLLRHLGGVAPVDFTPRMNRVRRVQSPLEIRLSEAAVRLNEETFRHYLQFVGPGRRELDAIAAASRFAAEAGAEELYWMAASGPLPRLAYLADARQRGHVWCGGDYHTIVLEHSAEGGYFGETTHLISLGDPDPRYVRAFAAVGEAQRAAAARIRPGATVGELADAAEAVLIERGYARPRGAGEPPAAIGHGQGADVWEFPRIVSGDATPIEPGMRFNIHPLAVLEDGARITSCDCHIATQDGSRRLSTLPYEIAVV